METIDTVDEQYQEGFNIGYWLARGDEQVQKDILHDLMRRQNPEIFYTQGLLAGKKQMEKEKLLDKIHSTTKAKDNANER